MKLMYQRSKSNFFDIINKSYKTNKKHNNNNNKYEKNNTDMN